MVFSHNNSFNETAHKFKAITSTNNFIRFNSKRMINLKQQRQITVHLQQGINNCEMNNKWVAVTKHDWEE